MAGDGKTSSPRTGRTPMRASLESNHDLVGSRLRRVLATVLGGDVHRSHVGGVSADRGVSVKPVLFPREAEIQKAILELLQVLGIPAWRANTGAVKATYHGRDRFIRFG